MRKFKDRHAAGIKLAKHLKEFANQSKEVIVLGLPRGGVPVAYEIAKALSLPLEVFIVRKLGIPGYEELAMGAIASGGICSLNKELIHDLQLDQSTIAKVQRSEQTELARREQLYRGHRPFPDLLNKIILLVDDGIATGFTMQVAIKALREQKPAKIIIAVPVAAHSTCLKLQKSVDKFVCPLQPINFYAVGLWYENFSQTSDDEVNALLNELHSTSMK